MEDQDREHVRRKREGLSEEEIARQFDSGTVGEHWTGERAAWRDEINLAAFEEVCNLCTNPTLFGGLNGWQQLLALNAWRQRTEEEYLRLAALGAPFGDERLYCPSARLKIAAHWGAGLVSHQDPSRYRLALPLLQKGVVSSPEVLLQVIRGEHLNPVWAPEPTLPSSVNAALFQACFCMGLSPWGGIRLPEYQGCFLERRTVFVWDRKVLELVWTCDNPQTSWVLLREEFF